MMLPSVWYLCKRKTKKKNHWTVLITEFNTHAIRRWILYLLDFISSSQKCYPVQWYQCIQVFFRYEILQPHQWYKKRSVWLIRVHCTPSAIFVWFETENENTSKSKTQKGDASNVFQMNRFRGCWMLMLFQSFPVDSIWLSQDMGPFGLYCGIMSTHRFKLIQIAFIPSTYFLFIRVRIFGKKK